MAHELGHSFDAWFDKLQLAQEQVLVQFRKSFHEELGYLLTIEIQELHTHLYITEFLGLGAS